MWGQTARPAWSVSGSRCLSSIQWKVGFVSLESGPGWHFEHINII